MSLLPPLLAVLALLWPTPPAPTVHDAGAWPLAPPELARAFDGPESPWDTAHRGVDLSGSPGQPVRAALDGRVTFAGVVAGRGVVVVSHGRFRTTYEPVVADVSVGDQVERGDRIGVLEIAGTHCPPRACLHWGLREGDRYLDPLSLIGVRKVRLLPLAGPR